MTTVFLLQYSKNIVSHFFFNNFNQLYEFIYHLSSSAFIYMKIIFLFFKFIYGFIESKSICTFQCNINNIVSEHNTSPVLLILIKNIVLNDIKWFCGTSSYYLEYLCYLINNNMFTQFKNILQDNYALKKIVSKL